MRPRLALSIGALAFLASGVLFVFAPAQALGAAGWPVPSNSTVVIARDGGLLMLTLAFIDWLGRDAVGAPLRALLWANIFVRVAGAAANAWEFAIGLTPPAVGFGLAAAIALDIALIVVFALALRNLGSPAGRPRHKGAVHAMSRDDSLSYFRDQSASSSGPGVQEEDRTSRWGENDRNSR